MENFILAKKFKNKKKLPIIFGKLKLMILFFLKNNLKIKKLI